MQGHEALDQPFGAPGQGLGQVRDVVVQMPQQLFHADVGHDLHFVGVHQAAALVFFQAAHLALVEMEQVPGHELVDGVLGALAFAALRGLGLAAEDVKGALGDVQEVIEELVQVFFQ